MSKLTPHQRVLRAQIASHASWANTSDRTARTDPARRGLMAKFEKEVDPDGSLPAEERAQRAEHLRLAHLKRCALRSAKVRSARAAGNTDAGAS